jgi:hypothetical protein
LAAHGGSLPAFSATLPQKQWVVAALLVSESAIVGKRCAIFGATDLTEAAMLLVLGAAHVTVVEHQALLFEHPNISTLLVAEARASYCHFTAGEDSSQSSMNHTQPRNGDGNAPEPAWQRFDVALSLSR